MTGADGPPWPQFPPGNAERLLDMVEHLEDIEDVSTLCRLLVP